MITEFANQNDVFDYINKHKLKLVVYDDDWWHWRSIFLIFEDKSYMRLELEDCYTTKFFKWTFYNGKIKVNSLNGVRCNYGITLNDIFFRNIIIDGIVAEEKRLADRAAEVFTNEVRNDNNDVYNYITKIGDVFFHYHEDCSKITHVFNPNDYKIIHLP